MNLINHNKLDKVYQISLFSILLVSILSINSTQHQTESTTSVDKGNRLKDSLALVDFYHQTKGQGWKEKWDFQQPMDTWYGITLNEYGRVKCVDLDGVPDCSPKKLSGNYLKDTLPDLQLYYLEHLFLASNQLSGPIPDFSSTPFLLTLQLSGNRLRGTIPDFSKLTRLTTLDLDFNQLSGMIPNFSQMTNIENLYLSNNQLTGTIPSLLSLHQIKRIYLHNNQLSGIVPNLSAATELQQLILANNQLEGSLSDFAYQPDLIYLNVTNNQLSGTIPDLSDKTQLKTVLLDDNQFDRGLEWVNIPGVSRLSMKGNQLDFADLQLYQKWLEKTDQYNFQAIPTKDTFMLINPNLSLQLKAKTSQASFSSNIYQWFKNDQPLSERSISAVLTLAPEDQKEGDEYYCEITNIHFPELMLKSNTFRLTGTLTEVTEQTEQVVASEDSYETSVQYNRTSSEAFISPNPVTKSDQYLTLEMQTASKKLTLIITDSAGRQFYQEEKNCQDGNILYRIPVQQLAAGAYFLSIQEDNGVQQGLPFVKL